MRVAVCILRQASEWRKEVAGDTADFVVECCSAGEGGKGKRDFCPFSGEGSREKCQLLSRGAQCRYEISV